MKNKLDIYTDGATIRLHNKRIKIKETNNMVQLAFEFADKNPEKPACGHWCIKGKVRQTYIQMSSEAMGALVMAYLEYKKNQKSQTK